MEPETGPGALFPSSSLSEKRQDVLELVNALKSEGMSLELLREEEPDFPYGAKTEDNPEEFDSI